MLCRGKVIFVHPHGRCAAQQGDQSLGAAGILLIPSTCLSWPCQLLRASLLQSLVVGSSKGRDLKKDLKRLASYKDVQYESQEDYF